MQSTPSSFRDVDQTGGIPATPSRSGIDPRIQAAAKATAAAVDHDDPDIYNAAFVAAALEKVGFGRSEAMAIGGILGKRLKEA